MTSVHSVVVVEDNGVVSAQRENVTYTQSGKDIRGTKMEISRVCFFLLSRNRGKEFQNSNNKNNNSTHKKWKSQSMNHARTSHLSIRQGGVEYRS